MNRIEQILDNTSNVIEAFHEKLQNNFDNITGKDFDHLMHHLDETHTEIANTLHGSETPNIKQETLDRIQKAITFFFAQPGAQIKVAALENALFYDTVKKFNNLLEHLKIKEGKKG